MIDKGPVNIDNFKRQCYYTESARQGERLFLEVLKMTYSDFEVIMPSYIGYSSNEGSGIYDPIISAEVKHRFYKMDRNLNIDIYSMKNVIEQCTVQPVILIVHYFGMPDPRLNEVVKICRDKNCIIIEDCAHAMYTDIVDGNCGMHGDAVLYSLHKMLPMKAGGVLIAKKNWRISVDEDMNMRRIPYNDYNLREIANIRKQNAKRWHDLLNGVEGIRFLREYQSDITYQTFPVLIGRTETRDKLYFKLNDKGFGGVSLYHKLVKPLYHEDFKDSVYISDHIFNLPVHQDVNTKMIDSMFEELLKIIRGE